MVNNNNHHPINGINQVSYHNNAFHQNHHQDNNNLITEPVTTAAWQVTLVLVVLNLDDPQIILTIHDNKHHEQILNIIIQQFINTQHHNLHNFQHYHINSLPIVLHLYQNNKQHLTIKHLQHQQPECDYRQVRVT